MTLLERLVPTLELAESPRNRTPSASRRPAGFDPEQTDASCGLTAELRGRRTGLGPLLSGAERDHQGLHQTDGASDRAELVRVHLVDQEAEA